MKELMVKLHSDKARNVVDVMDRVDIEMVLEGKTRLTESGVDKMNMIARALWWGLVINRSELSLIQNKIQEAKV